MGCEGITDDKEFVRIVPASARGPHGAVAILAVRDVPDERLLSEIPAAARGALRGLRGARADDAASATGAATLGHLHHSYQASQLFAHFGGGELHLLAMPRQDPLKMKLRELGHRLGLFAPGVPAVIFGRRQLPGVAIPIEMIAGSFISRSHAPVRACWVASTVNSGRGCW